VCVNIVHATAEHHATTVGRLGLSRKTEEKEKTNMVQCTPAAHKPVEDTTKLLYNAIILCVSGTIG